MQLNKPCPDTINYQDFFGIKKISNITSEQNSIQGMQKIIEAKLYNKESTLCINITLDIIHQIITESNFIQNLFHETLIIADNDLKIALYELLHDFISFSEVEITTTTSPIKLISAMEMKSVNLRKYSHIFYIGTEFILPPQIFGDSGLYIFIISNYSYNNILQFFKRQWIVIYFGKQTDRLISVNNLNTFSYNDFNYQNIYNYWFSTTDAASEYYYTLAKKSGFELKRQDSKNSDHIRYYCRSNCKFSIYLKKIDQNEYQTTKAVLIHDHEIDPQFTFHLLATSDQIDLIHAFKESNIKNTIIAKIMSQLYGSFWANITTRQIRSLYEQRSLSNVDEIKELDELITANGGIIRYLPSIEDPIAIFTATKDEIDNGEVYGDVIVIDGTHYPNRNGFELVPVTCFDKSLHICSGGTLFSKNSTREVYLFLISCLMEFCSIITIISDEESGIVSVMDCEYQNIGHIICAWHKKKNIIKRVMAAFKNSQYLEEILKNIDIICYSYDLIKVNAAINYIKDLESPSFIEYFNNNVIPILHKFSPAYIECFCLGKNVSSAGESANSLIKSTISARYYRLAQIKCEITRLYKRKEVGERDRIAYRRRNRESFFQTIFHIELPEEILKILDYSLEKTSRLQLIHDETDKIIVKDPKNEKTNIIYFDGGNLLCSCKKLLITGLPCSHILKYCIDQNMIPLIHPRFQGTQSVSNNACLSPMYFNLFNFGPHVTKQKPSKYSNKKITYNVMLNRCKDIIKRIEKNEDLVDDFINTLNEVEEKFNLRIHEQHGRPTFRRFKAYDE